jgi:hypothetical protein
MALQGFFFSMLCHPCTSARRKYKFKDSRDEVAFAKKSYFICKQTQAGCYLPFPSLEQMEHVACVCCVFVSFKK